MSQEQRCGFGSLAAFVEYRRLRGGGTAASHANAGGARLARAADLTALKREWDLNAPTERGAPLQDEFDGDYEAYLSYCRHEAAGDITILAGTQAVRPPNKPARPSRRYTALDEQRDRATFAGSARLQAEFQGDPEAYIAYRRHAQAGCVTVLAQHALQTTGEQCSECRHLAAGDVCSVFADGIPEQIRSGAEPCTNFEAKGAE
jgi:hypothetical protein